MLAEVIKILCALYTNTKMEKIRVWGLNFQKVPSLELGINSKLYFIVEKKVRDIKKEMVKKGHDKWQIPQKGLMGIEYERDHCQLLY